MVRRYVSKWDGVELRLVASRRRASWRASFPAHGRKATSTLAPSRALHLAPHRWPQRRCRDHRRVRLEGLQACGARCGTVAVSRRRGRGARRLLRSPSDDRAPPAQTICASGAVGGKPSGDIELDVSRKRGPEPSDRRTRSRRTRRPPSQGRGNLPRDHQRSDSQRHQTIGPTTISAARGLQSAPSS